MGAWGVLTFDNDDANDWAYGLDDVDDLSLVESTFDVLEESDDYLEAPDASNALAACEVLARLNGKPGYKNSYTEKVDDWVAAHPLKPSDDLRKTRECGDRSSFGRKFRAEGVVGRQR